MVAIIQNNKSAIAEICKKFKVLELYVFGSALTSQYVERKSDIDFAILFDPNIPVEDMADHYFGIIEALERLLGHQIDLVTLKSVKNKIFKAELEKTMVPLYAA